MRLNKIDYQILEQLVIAHKRRGAKPGALILSPQTGLNRAYMIRAYAIEMMLPPKTRAMFEKVCDRPIRYVPKSVHPSRWP